MLLFLLNPPELSGAEDLITLLIGAIALVLFTAWATGFLQMELAGAFRLGGDVDEAFDYGLDRLIHGLTAE